MRSAPELVIATVPLVPVSSKESTVFEPPSGSVSLARTSIDWAESSSPTVFESSTAVGLSSTQVTSTETVAEVPPFRV